MGKVFRNKTRRHVIPLAILVVQTACIDWDAAKRMGLRGPAPRSGKVVCNIEQPSGRHCASAEEKAGGIRLAAAAEALVTGQTSTIGLDDSPAALARCNGEPEAILFEGPFPQGTDLCLNCSATTSHPADEQCQALCEGMTPPTQSSADCAQRAHVATNMTAACFADGCTADAAPLDTFIDPRIAPEPVDWQNRIGVDVKGNQLVRIAPTNGLFDAGAASTQTIAAGDGYVQFAAVEVNTARLCGLSNGAPPDTDPTYPNITFAIDLFKDGYYYIFERGTKVPGPDINQSFGAYAPGDRFRVRVSDNFDGTGTVTYSRLTASCVDGKPCPENVFHVSAVKAVYPVRVDSSFREQDGTIADAKIVRIH